MPGTERERRMSMLRAALPYTAGDRRQALEILLQADALISIARKAPGSDLEACDMEANPEEMLLHMQEYCTPRESDFIQMILNFLQAGHLFQNYREFLMSHQHTSTSADVEAAGYHDGTSNQNQNQNQSHNQNQNQNPLQLLLQMIGGLGSSGNLMEFLLTQLPPEQRQLFEQLSSFAAAGTQPTENPS